MYIFLSAIFPKLLIFSVGDLSIFNDFINHVVGLVENYAEKVRTK